MVHPAYLTRSDTQRLPLMLLSSYVCLTHITPSLLTVAPRGGYPTLSAEVKMFRGSLSAPPKASTTAPRCGSERDERFIRVYTSGSASCPHSPLSVSEFKQLFIMSTPDSKSLTLTHKNSVLKREKTLDPNPSAARTAGYTHIRRVKGLPGRNTASAGGQARGQS